ncbi:MAG: ribulose-phosphate 3-epimerase [Legionella sp.]
MHKEIRPYKILPSLLAANPMRLEDEVESVIKAGAQLLHLDVMDNHYVPNLSFGPMVCQALHTAYPRLSLDVHLMASPVDTLIKQFAKAGASRISIHPEATNHLDRSLQLIRELDCQVGLVLNPATPIEYVRWCEHRLDFLVLMMVNPGFSGQSMITTMINKIAYVRDEYPLLPICVDGGITIDNINALAAAGANEFVAGSAIFQSQDYQETISTMQRKLLDFSSHK